MATYVCSKCDGLSFVCANCGLGRRERRTKFGNDSCRCSSRKKPHPCGYKHTLATYECDVCRAQTKETGRIAKLQVTPTKALDLCEACAEFISRAALVAVDALIEQRGDINRNTPPDRHLRRLLTEDK